AITEFGRDLIVIVNEDGGITYVSPSGARLLGQDALALLGRPLRDLIHPDDQPVLFAALADVAKKAQALRPVIARARVKDGNWMTLEGTGYNMLHHPAVHGI